jgi:hypothetical protein
MIHVHRWLSSFRFVWLFRLPVHSVQIRSVVQLWLRPLNKPSIFSRWRIRCDVRFDSVIVGSHCSSHQGNGAIHPLVLYPIPHQLQAVSPRVIRSPNARASSSQAPPAADASPPNNDQIPASTRRGAHYLFPGPPCAAHLLPPQGLPDPMRHPSTPADAALIALPSPLC